LRGWRRDSYLQETDQVGLSGVLESKYGRAFEPELGFVFSSDVSDQALEGELPYQKVSALLLLSNFTQGHGARPELVVFFIPPADGALFLVALLAVISSGP